jgi:hypothetical protein
MQDGIVELLVRAIGLDPMFAQPLVGASLPLTVAALPVEAARSVLGELKRAGVRVVAPTNEQMALVPTPEPLKTFAMGAFSESGPMALAVPWRGESWAFALRHIKFIVRAHLTRRRVTAYLDGGGGPGGAWLAGDEDFPTNSDEGVSPIIRQTRHEFTDIIDLFIQDPSRAGRMANVDERVAGWHRLRINGSKFDFRTSLGQAFALTDIENADRLALAITESAPNAAIDLGFSDFRPPTAVVLTRVSPTTAGAWSDDLPKYEFYARLVWLLSRRRE